MVIEHDKLLGSELERLAAEIAMEAPVSAKTWFGRSKPKATLVRWELIEQIRAVLQDRNYDWAAVRLQRRLIDRERERVNGKRKGLVGVT